MGVPDGHGTPPRPLENGDYWEMDNTSRRLLRPSWDAWQPNASSWASEVVDKIMSDGHHWYHIPVEDLQRIPRLDIQDAVAAAWRTAKNKYKLAQQSAEAKEARAQKARETTRRGNVSPPYYSPV